MTEKQQTMTLVLTEVSTAGIAMVADSAISWVDPCTNKRLNIERPNWRKLLRVPKIKAGISYWGDIGRITTDRFDEWLESRIHLGKYENLEEFARYIAETVNLACNRRVLHPEHRVGFHIAGVHKWTDGIPRPTFFHVHNGHMTTKVSVRTSNSVIVASAGTASINLDFPTGDALGRRVDKLIAAAQEPGAKLDWQTESEPTKLFEEHRDFPADGVPLEVNLSKLKVGHLTRNGDYVPFVMIAGMLDMVRVALNTVPGVCVPRDPGKIGARIGYLHMMAETVVRTYRCSTMEQRIGGELTTLGITPEGTYYDDEDFQKSSWARC